MDWRQIADTKQSRAEKARKQKKEARICLRGHGWLHRLEVYMAIARPNCTARQQEEPDAYHSRFLRFEGHVKLLIYSDAHCKPCPFVLKDLGIELLLYLSAIEFGGNLLYIF